jgi:hypothetical protein
MPVQLEQVRPLDVAEIGAGAALVHLEQRFLALTFRSI